jgi:hypothetical protein
LGKESLEELKSRGFDARVQESFALAKKVAYRDGKLRGAGTETTGKCSRPITPPRPNPLPTGVPPSPGTGSRRSCEVVWARKHRSRYVSRRHLVALSGSSLLRGRTTPLTYLAGGEL